MPYGITQYYLPPGRPAEVTFPPLCQPIKAGTAMSIIDGIGHAVYAATDFLHFRQHGSLFNYYASCI